MFAEAKHSPRDGATEAAAATPTDFGALETQIRSRMDLYSTLARDVGFQIAFTNGQTCFDHETLTLNISLPQLYRLGIRTIAELDFIVLHELGHLKEYREDPEGYLEILDWCDRKGPPLDQHYFGLHNCLADVYVNTNTAYIAPVYAKGEEFSPEVHDIYRHKAFKERDFTKQPFSSQFMHYLLNLGMGVGDDVVLSPEVRKEIDAGTRLLGDDLDYQSLLKQYFTPELGRPGSSSWRATASQRNFVTKTAVLPAFERLLALDLAAARDLCGANFHPLASADLDMSEVKKVIQRITSDNSKANRSAKELADDERQKQAEQIGKESGLNNAQATDFATRLNRLQPIVNDLVSILKDVQIPATFMEKIEEGHDIDGVELDVDQAIEEFAGLQQSPQNAKVLLQERYVNRQELTPKKVRIWMVIDLSGSMSDQLTHLKDCTICLTASAASLNLESELGENNLRGELAVLGYSDGYRPIILPSNNITLSDAATAHGKISADGSTYEASALKEVVKLHRARQESDLDSGIDTLDILVALTDGETSMPNESIRALKTLKNQGMTIMAGVKIIGGGGNGLFERIWNPDRGDCSRHYLQDAAGLPNLIRKILEDYRGKQS